MILTAVTMISGLSGAAVNVGPVQLKGMGLAVVCGMIISIVFYILPNSAWIIKNNKYKTLRIITP